MPAVDELPSDVSFRSGLQASVLTDRTFEYNIDRLATELENRFGVSDRRTKIPAMVGAVQEGVRHRCHDPRRHSCSDRVLSALARREPTAHHLVCRDGRGSRRHPHPDAHRRLCVRPDGDELMLEPAASSENQAGIEGDGDVFYTALETFHGEDECTYGATAGMIRSLTTEKALNFLRLAPGLESYDIPEAAAVGPAARCAVSAIDFFAAAVSFIFSAQVSSAWASGPRTDRYRRHRGPGGLVDASTVNESTSEAPG